MPGLSEWLASLRLEHCTGAAQRWCHQILGSWTIVWYVLDLKKWPKIHRSERNLLFWFFFYFGKMQRIQDLCQNERWCWFYHVLPILQTTKKTEEWNLLFVFNQLKPSTCLGWKKLFNAAAAEESDPPFGRGCWSCPMLMSPDLCWLAMNGLQKWFKNIKDEF